jgi:hypothetical protein
MESNNRLNIKQNWSTLIYALWTVYSDKWENPITSLSTFHWLKRIVWYRFYSSIVVKKRAIQNNHNLKLFKMLGDERQTEIVFETCLISFGATKLSFQALSIEILRSYCPVGGTRNELTSFYDVISLLKMKSAKNTLNDEKQTIHWPTTFDFKS